MCRIGGADESAALYDETRNGTMNKTRGERMCRRVGNEIPAGIHVIQKVGDGDWLMLSIQRDVEKARA